MQLSPKQEQVLAAIAAGQTITVAAAEAGVHRNTVSNWMRESAGFREALATAQSCQRAYWREQAEQRAAAPPRSFEEFANLHNLAQKSATRPVDGNPRTP